MQHISVAVHITCDTVVCYDHEPSFCYKVVQRHFICPTNSLTSPKTEECSAIEQNFASLTGLSYRTFAIRIKKKQ